MQPSELYQKLRLLDDRALAKAASLVENRKLGYLDLLQMPYQHTGQARLIGVTGAPGSGKSTLINALTLELVRSGKTVAVIAVDPSSPITEGAVLGDRIRMKSAAEHVGVFVRSISSRGHRGGVSLALADLIDLFDAAGFNYVIVETVGVGQVEIDIHNLVNQLLLVLTPGMGDEVQAMKAGVLELADCFVINKSDLPGADMLESILKSAALSAAATPENFALVRTAAQQGTGVVALIDSIDRHFQKLTAATRQQRTLKLSRERIEQELVLLLKNYLGENEQQVFASHLQNVQLRQQHPALAASEIFKKWRIK